SQYSKNITDEKGAGFKSIHISSYGQDLLIDENGEIIRTDVYSRNPEAFRNQKLSTRTLRTTKEVKDGVTTYWVEVILPKPNFHNRQEEEFWMEKVSKMFATRIPTEDKRSMVALKVVDFMDSA